MSYKPFAPTSTPSSHTRPLPGKQHGDSVACTQTLNFQAEVPRVPDLARPGLPRRATCGQFPEPSQPAGAQARPLP